MISCKKILLFVFLISNIILAQGSQNRIIRYNNLDSILTARGLIDTTRFGVALDSLYNKTGHIYTSDMFLIPKDSVTDATADIQAALEYINLNGGGTFVFVDGQFRISSPIACKDNVNVVGTSWNAIVENAGNDFRAFDVTNTHNIIFENFQIRGDFLTMLTNHNSQGGIHCIQPGSITDSTYNITIQNMYFNNLGGDAVTINSNATGIKILNNTWEDGLGFVQLIGTVATPVDNILIQGNTILGSVVSERSEPGGISGSDDIIDMWGTIKNVNIVDNYLDGRRTADDTTTVNHGVLILGVDNPLMGSFTNINVENNTFVNFHNNRQTPPGNTYYTVGAIEVGFANAGADSSAETITIRNNKLFSDRGRQIFLIYPKNDMLVDGNEIVGGETGIFINTIPGSETDLKEITNNRIRGFTHNGIYLQGSNTLIKDNVINMDSLDSAGGDGIRITVSDSNYIIGNTIEGGDTIHRGLYVIQSKYHSIVGNKFRNIPGTAVVFNTDTVTTGIIFRGNDFINVGTEVINENVQDIFTGTFNDEYTADKFKVGTDEYFESNGLSPQAVNNQGNITDLDNPLTETPYKTVNHINNTEVVNDAIFNFFKDEVLDRQLQLLTPAVDDTMDVWLRTDGMIIIDSVRLSVVDSATVQVYFGNDSLFINPELITVDTTISDFDNNTIPANSKVKLFFTALGDGVTSITLVVYYRNRGTNTFIKNVLLDSYLARVTSNGGTIIDTSAVESFYDMMVSNGAVDTIKHWSGTSFGVEFDADSNITGLFDLSIYKNDVFQTDTTYSPDLQLSQVNGYGTASYDGSDDFMLAFVDGLAQPETVFLVGKARTWEGNRYFFDAYSIPAKNSILMQNFTPETRLFSDLLGCGVSINVGSFDILTAVFDGSNSSFAINNSVAVTCSLGTDTTDGFTLGSLGGDIAYYEVPGRTRVAFAEVDISEQGIIDKNASDALKTIIQTFLNTKYSTY